jgi:hypothetical protein
LAGKHQAKALSIIWRDPGRADAAGITLKTYSCSSEGRTKLGKKRCNATRHGRTTGEKLKKLAEAAPGNLLWQMPTKAIVREKWGGSAASYRITTTIRRSCSIPSSTVSR